MSIYSSGFSRRSSSGGADPTSTLLNAIRGKGERVNPAGRRGSYLCRCPAHDDHDFSLSITRGDEGRALVQCRAGCSVELICAALGMQVQDLMPPSPPPPPSPSGPPVSTATAAPAGGDDTADDRPGPAWPTHGEALEPSGACAAPPDSPRPATARACAPPAAPEAASPPSLRVGLRRLNTVARREVEWLWPGRIPLGKLTLLAGDPGLGKSFVTLDIAARISAGRSFPDDATGEQALAGDVLLLSAEDDPADTILPRLEQMGARLDHVTVLDHVRCRDSGQIRRCARLDMDTEAIEEALDALAAPRLLIIDPISAYMGGVDSHRNADVREVLAALADMAQRRRLAVLAVTHLNKGAGGKAVYRAMGSLAFTAAARVVLMAKKHPDDPESRLLLPVKSNVRSATTALSYRIASGSVEWGDALVAIDADEVENGAQEGATTGVEEAAAWLAAALVGGPLPARVVIAEARTDGIAQRTLERAKRRLSVQSRRHAGAWSWFLPPRPDAGAADSADAPEPGDDDLAADLSCTA